MSEHDVKCGECGRAMRLRPGKFGQFYACTGWPECKGAHGAHPDGSPMGIPADKATRAARIAAHDAFDSLWKSGPLSRRQAYRWLQETLSLSVEEAHISRFTLAQCDTVVRALSESRP